MKSGGKELFFELDKDTSLYFIALKRLKPDDQEMNDISAETIDGKNVKKVKFEDDIDNNGEENSKKKKKTNEMDINQAHRCWGHPGKSRMNVFAQQIGIKLINEFKECDACKVAKIKCNSIKKETETKASKPGERIFIDTSGPFPQSLGAILIGEEQ